MKKATSQQTKQHNRDLVLRTIFTNDPVSRAEAARITGLTRTTVSDVVSGLMDEGLVEESGKGESSGGKTPILLRLVANSRYMLALNLAQTKFAGAVVNLRGEIIRMVEEPTLAHYGWDALETVYRIIDQLLQDGCTPIVGIGVGAPGLIDSRQGIVVNAVNLDWQDLPLGKILSQRYHLPVSVLNDSQATAIGEYVYGELQGREGNLVVVNVQHGIGAGILINSRLFQGDGGGAGEIGHVVLREDGAVCRCGRRGCLETVASASAVLARLKLTSIDEVLAALEAGDGDVKQVIESAGHDLGMVLAGMVGVLNIQHIILTGEMSRLGRPWLESVRATVQNASLARLVERTQIELGCLDYTCACILGAAAFLLLDDYSLLYTQENAG